MVCEKGGGMAGLLAEVCDYSNDCGENGLHFSASRFHNVLIAMHIPQNKLKVKQT